MAYGMGLLLHLKTGRSFSTNEWMCLVPSVVGSRECGLTSTEARLPQPQRDRLRDFCSSAQPEPDPSVHWVHTSCATHAIFNLQQWEVTQGFDVATDLGMPWSILILFHTHSSAPHFLIVSFFHHMLTTESSLATLCIPSATCFISFHSLPFLICPLAAPLARSLVLHVWTMGRPMGAPNGCLGPRDILIWGHLEGKGKEYREL